MLEPMPDPIPFRPHQSRRKLAASKDAALTSLDQAVEILRQYKLELVAGTVTREVDDLMLELDDTLAPLGQFLAEELKPEYSPTED